MQKRFSKYKEINELGSRKWLVLAEGATYIRNCGKNYQDKIYVKCKNKNCSMKGAISTKDQTFQHTKGDYHNHELDQPPDKSAEIHKTNSGNLSSLKFPLPISKVRQVDGKNIILYTKLPYINGIENTPRIIYINTNLCSQEVDSSFYDIDEDVQQDDEPEEISVILESNEEFLNQESLDYDGL